jgi:hypothetical protein
MSICVVYSSICETDLSAYKCYLNTLKDVSSEPGRAVGVVFGAGGAGVVGRECEEPVVCVAGGSVGFRGLSVGWPALEDVSDSGLGGGCGEGVDDRSRDGGAQVVDGAPVAVDGGGLSCGEGYGLGNSGGSKVRDDVRAAGIGCGVGVVGPNGGKSYGRGTNYVRNQIAREKKRLNRQSGVRGASGSSGTFVVAEKTDLQKSLEEKWQVENQLAKLRAEQQLDLLRARDMDKVKRMQAAQVVRTTEKCKVETERAFASLAKSGDVPGFAETIVSGASSGPGLTNGSRSSGTYISPDSSVSQQEIRQMQKDLLDKDAEIAKWKSLCLGVVGEKEPIKPPPSSYTLDSDGCLPKHAPQYMMGYEENGRFYRDNDDTGF